MSDDPEVRVMAERVERLQNEMHALRSLPQAVATMTVSLEHVKEGQQRLEKRLDDADDAEVRRVVALREDVTGLRSEMGVQVGKLDARIAERFDRVDQAHDRARGIDWRTVLAVVTGVTVPIAAVLIANGGAG